MAKITKDDIIGSKGLGFTQSMYSVIASDDTAFQNLVDEIIAEQAAELEDRVGSAVYGLAANLTFLKKAERCLVAAELIQRRINIMLGVAQTAGQEVKTENEHRQRRTYLDSAEAWISKLAQGATSDPATNFASGALVTTHFE